jgi:hypothetical protein
MRILLLYLVLKALPRPLRSSLEKSLAGLFVPMPNMYSSQNCVELVRLSANLAFGLGCHVTLARVVLVVVVEWLEQPRFQLLLVAFSFDVDFGWPIVEAAGHLGVLFEG